VWTFATWALVLAVRHHGIGAIAAAHGAITVAMVLWLVAWAGRHMGRSLWSFYAGPVLAGVGAVAATVAHRLATRSSGEGWAPPAIALATYALLVGLVEGRRVRDDLRGLVNALLKRG
jgi:hypothetical protein